MAAVTIDAGAQNSYYSAGNLGWSARSIFAYRTAIQQLTGSAGSTWGNASTAEAMAQSFTPSANIDVSDIRVALNKVMAPTDNLSVSIYSDTGANLPNASIATANNVYNGAGLSTSVVSWLEFHFNTAVSLTSGSKYWIVVQRSGAVDATNHYAIQGVGTSAYAGGGRSILVSGVWGAESSTIDLAFQILTETPSALYAVTQSTEPALHVWKSTDSGASWTEQDAANNPTVTNANYPFDACDTRSGPYIGTAFFTATNTIRARLFDMSTDTWGADIGAADATTAASNERSIRFLLANGFYTAAPGSQEVWMTSSVDDADLVGSRRTNTTWNAVSNTNFLSASSTEASLIADVVVDKAPLGFQHRMYYDCANDDFFMRSAWGVTYGTQTALDTTAADVETEHASAVYQIYQASNVDKIVAAYIDADGSIQERTATLEVTSASVTLGTEHAVGTATTTAGRQLSTCEYDGDLYVIANVSGTGIDYYVDAGATGSWDSGTSFKSGLTACTLSMAISIPGMGLAVVYTDNGDTKIDWIAVVAGGVSETGSATVGTASASGGTHTGTGQRSETGTTTVGTSAAAGGNHTGTATTVVNETGTTTVGTAASAGGGHVISAGARGTTVAGRASAGSYIQNMNENASAAVGNNATQQAVAQSITADVTGTHTTVDIRGARAATITGGNVWFEIQSDLPDKPSGTVLFTSDWKAKDSVPTSISWHTFTFTTPYTLVGGTRYWFCYRTDTPHATETMTWRLSTTPDQWDTEGYCTYNGTVWATQNLTGDLAIVIPSLTQGQAGTTGVATSGDAAATGGTHTGAGGSTINESGTATVGTATATGGAHTAASGATGATTIGTAAATGGAHTATGYRNEIGTHTRGQATASGGSHTGAGQRVESGTHTRGQATAAGGAHTAGGGASGTATSGTATAPGGAAVATAGATGAAATGVAAAAGGTHTTVVTQTTGVIGDVTSGGWTREDGSTTNLYDSINEGVAADADYIRSPLSPASPTAVTLQLGPLTEPTTRNDHIISYRYSVDAPVGTTLIVRLYQGATLIATDAPQTPTETWVTRDWELDVADAEDITDYSNLRVELEAVVT